MSLNEVVEGGHCLPQPTTTATQDRLNFKGRGLAVGNKKVFYLFLNELTDSPGFVS